MVPIKPLEKGATPSPMETAYFNQIVFLLNALIAAQVTPGGFGKINVGERNIVFDFSSYAGDAENRLKNLESQLTNANTQIAQLLNALKGASVSATCNPDGSISITINFPGI